MAQLPVSALLSRHSNERRGAAQLLLNLKAKDLVIYDRGYMSSKLLTLHNRLGVDGLFRLSKTTFLEIREFLKSKKKDGIIEIKRKDLDVRLRVLRYKVKGSEIVLATTLLDQSKFPYHAVTKLYHKRWSIEEAFKTLKFTLKLENWHSRSPIGVKQELFISLIKLFFIRMLRLNGLKSSPIKKTIDKPSEKVCHQIIRKLALKKEVGLSIRLSRWQEVVKVSKRYQTKTLLGRSFPRVSKQPIGKFRLPRKKRERMARVLAIAAETQILR